MKRLHIILSFLLLLATSFGSTAAPNMEPVSFDFYGEKITLPHDYSTVVSFDEPLTANAIGEFYTRISATNYQPVVKALLDYKEQHKADDWLFYQLIRKTAQYTSPKADNYVRYTLYKWFLLTKCGYDARLRTSGKELLFYVRSDENIYDIPFYTVDGRKYVCLNFHDYPKLDIALTTFEEINLAVPEAIHAFSYKLTQLPDFKPEDYVKKDLRFDYRDFHYHFMVKVNSKVKDIFANYPVTDYQLHFNAPLSTETYGSLIPPLKKNLKGLSIKNGVDYLMRFTRYAFLFRKDAEHFGKEKRLTPEQTLLFEGSDCEDRAALFFYLVKEIYNLPMIVLVFPEHVTIAVKFDKPVGKPIMYNGEQYSVCEPTPQGEDVSLGHLPSSLDNVPYEVAYAYHPQ